MLASACAGPGGRPGTTTAATSTADDAEHERSTRGDATAHHPNRPRHVVERALVVGLEEHLLGRSLLRRCTPGSFSAARKNAQYCDTRCACCMLCVTITIVTSSRSSSIVSSMRRVEVGSSAEHGSSISRTSGRTASARAMHSRCCWPPESAPPGRAEPVLHLVPQSGPLEAVLERSRASCRARAACRRA